jgi:DNA-binding helix-hairpin-helix protein with protein kinase domain
MKSVYVCNREIALSSRNSIGKGGEADVYNVGNGLALKVFKTPDHPDLQVFDPVERQSLVCAAQERIETHQRKLRIFPHGLPASVLAPIDLAYDRKGAGGRIVGYTMPFIDGADLLFQYGKRAWRESAVGAGVNEESVRDLLLDLHLVVRGIHGVGVVIGDFNDLNVLVKDGRVYMVDADSFQYGGFLCNTFQYRFLDPLLCKAVGNRPEMSRPHNTGSDWYAYSAMVMQCLLYVDPYGGLHKPADPSHKVADLARPLHRLTVFSPEVQYPKAALPICVLPDDLLQYLHTTGGPAARPSLDQLPALRQPPRAPGVSLLRGPSRRYPRGGGADRVA